jgi:lipopolysaccharide export LptBFGC system permease protein LptF
MRILDRYVLRQMAWPFALGILVFEFLLIVPQMMLYAEQISTDFPNWREVAKKAPSLCHL